MIKPVVNSSNYAGQRKVLETNPDGIPSQTVPDMTISLRQMLDRYNSGGKVKTFQPVYVGEDSIVPVGLEKMDKVERAQLSRQLTDVIANSRGKLVTARQARLDEERKSLRKASVPPTDVEVSEADI